MSVVTVVKKLMMKMLSQIERVRVVNTYIKLAYTFTIRRMSV